VGGGLTTSQARRRIDGWPWEMPLEGRRPRVLRWASGIAAWWASGIVSLWASGIVSLWASRALVGLGRCQGVWHAGSYDLAL